VSGRRVTVTPGMVLGGLGAALFLACCGGAPAPASGSAFDRQSEAYIKLVAALGERDPDSLDYYAGPSAWFEQARASRESLETIRDKALALLAEIRPDEGGSREDARREFLAGQVAAIAARVDVLRGARWTFDEESRRLFGVEAGVRDEAVFAAIRTKLAALLPGAGSLASRYAVLSRHYVVPAEHVSTLMTRAIDECRRRTVDHLQLPAGEHVDVEYVRGLPWPAFTRYRGHGRSITQINRDVALTVDQVVDVACHETYPGHHAINVLLDQAAQPMFSPLTFRTEGAASYAVELAFPDADRAAFERDLCRLAGVPDADLERYLRVARLVDGLRWVEVDVARRYLDGRLEFVRAARALEDEAVMPEASADATLKFVNRFRTYSVTYTAGYDAVRTYVRTADESSRWRAFRQWIGP
jgi:hypothetical protein